MSSQKFRRYSCPGENRITQKLHYWPELETATVHRLVNGGRFSGYFREEEILLQFLVA